MSTAVTALPVKLVSQSAYVAGAVMAPYAAKVFGINGTHKGTGASWVHVFDSATTPADGEVPTYSIYNTAPANFNIDFGFHGADFKNGIYVCHSSTGATKTLGAADIQIYVRLTPNN